jgi:hypothetical protein
VRLNTDNGEKSREYDTKREAIKILNNLMTLCVFEYLHMKEVVK